MHDQQENTLLPKHFLQIQDKYEMTEYQLKKTAFNQGAMASRQRFRNLVC